VDSQGIDDPESALVSVEAEVEDAEVHGVREQRRDTHDQQEAAAVELDDLDAQFFTEPNMTVTMLYGLPCGDALILMFELPETPILHPRLGLLGHQRPCVITFLDFCLARAMRYLENKDVVLIDEVREPVLLQCSLPLRARKCRIETDTAKACF